MSNARKSRGPLATLALAVAPHSFVLACLYAGIVHGAAGALNVAIAALWLLVVIGIPAGATMTFAPHRFMTETAEVSPLPLRVFSTISTLLEILAVAHLGRIVLAVGLALAWLALAGYRSRYDRNGRLRARAGEPEPCDE